MSAITGSSSTTLQQRSTEPEMASGVHVATLLTSSSIASASIPAVHEESFLGQVCTKVQHFICACINWIIDCGVEIGRFCSSPRQYHLHRPIRNALGLIQAHYKGSRPLETQIAQTLRTLPPHVLQALKAHTERHFQKEVNKKEAELRREEHKDPPLFRLRAIDQVLQQNFIHYTFIDVLESLLH